MSPAPIEGVFVRMDERTAKIVWEVVDSFGFEHNGEGFLKAFVSLAVETEDSTARPSSFADALTDYLKANPDAAQIAKAAAGRLASAVFAHMRKGQ